MSSIEKRTPASCAIASMCNTVFVEPPIAISIDIELSIDSLVTNERGNTDTLPLS
ncbi:hypothetical protein SDC9_155635 [bioreactor metagenome]|uniref:Uncharacterized protein n=1 Tax=bioreactor metagenome TaxID=1076179 RepID=A0A645F795_9ZZZZ